MQELCQQQKRILSLIKTRLGDKKLKEDKGGGIAIAKDEKL